MPVPRDIIADVRSFVELELQAGRRRVPLDQDAVAAFLSIGVCGSARPEAPPAAPPPFPRVELSAAVPKPAPAAAPAGGTLEEIAGEIKLCNACALGATRAHAVPGEGSASSPDVMFVGEGPGAEEDAQGRPFVGAAGQLLDRMIAAMGYRREDVYIANIVKCRPPKNRTPLPDEMSCCIPFLLRQIGIVRPKVIVSLGATAFTGLLGPGAGALSRSRGAWREFRGIPLMPTFHPAYLLRVPAAKRAVWEDLKNVLARLGRAVPS